MQWVVDTIANASFQLGRSFPIDESCRFTNWLWRCSRLYRDTIVWGTRWCASRGLDIRLINILWRKGLSDTTGRHGVFCVFVLREQRHEVADTVFRLNQVEHQNDRGNLIEKKCNHPAFGSDCKAQIYVATFGHHHDGWNSKCCTENWGIFARCPRSEQRTRLDGNLIRLSFLCAALLSTTFVL